MQTFFSKRPLSSVQGKSWSCRMDVETNCWKMMCSASSHFQYSARWKTRRNPKWLPAKTTTHQKRQALFSQQIQQKKQHKLQQKKTTKFLKIRHSKFETGKNGNIYVILVRDRCVTHLRSSFLIFFLMIFFFDPYRFRSDCSWINVSARWRSWVRSIRWRRAAAERRDGCSSFPRWTPWFCSTRTASHWLAEEKQTDVSRTILFHPLKRQKSSKSSKERKTFVNNSVKEDVKICVRTSTLENR